MSIDPSNPSAPTLVKQGKQAWHPEAWKMYDLVGEVKGGGRFMESAASA
jgi:hypothetical protein